MSHVLYPVDMTRAASYPKADTSTQNFAKAYRGSTVHPNVVVTHTTEGPSWPSYSGGATAPNLTANPNMKTKRLEWRQHFPLTMSARALRNESGGVETNTLNTCQVELIGTCDPKRKGASGWMFWPEAPDWALDQYADFLAWMHEEWSLRLTAAPLWLPYPSSYGSSKARFSDAKWRGFYGVCGHQHVPENSHGDPGNMDMKKVISMAKDKVKPKAPPKPKSKTPRADKVVEVAQEVLDGKGTKTSNARLKEWATIRDAAQALQRKK